MAEPQSGTKTGLVSTKPGILKRTYDRRTVLGGAVGAVAVIGAGVRPASKAAGSGINAPVTISSNKQTVANLVDGTALIASPKLPLYGVGENDLPGLFDGSTTDWANVGSPAAIAVKPVALADNVPSGMTPAETFASYDELATYLWDNPGAVAVVPVDQVDFRASVLSVQGFDPLRDQSGDAEPMRVAFVGDIVPGRNVSAKIAYYGNDWVRPFRKIASELKSYDTVIANLEGNVSANIAAPTDPHTFSFVSDPQFIEGLVYGGIDAVSLANNHSVWNDDGWGLGAFNDTRAALDQYEIPHFGAGDNLSDASAPWVVEAKGLKVAIYGVDGVTANNEQSAGVLSDYVGATNDGAGTNPFATDQFTSDIQSLASQYDVVIPYFHMGVEYVPIPPDWALQGARNAIDAGATMVVTNHPHLIQGMEIYDGKPIVYSVGNFVFDQMFSNEVRTGSILEIVLQNGKVVGLRPKGVEIVDFHQPRLMTAGEHASLMDRFWSSSRMIRS